MQILIFFSISFVLFYTAASQIEQPRDIFSPLESFANSLLGITTTSSVASTSANPQATIQTTPALITSNTNTQLQSGASATATGSLTVVLSTSSSGSSSSEPTSSSSETSTSSVTSAASTTSEASITSTPTASSSTTLTQSSSSAAVSPHQTLPTSSFGSTSPNSNNGSNISPAGVAVAVIFSVLILLAVVYLVFKFTPCIQRKVAIREERRIEARTYRKALDPELGQIETKGLGLGDLASLKTFPLDAKNTRSSAAESFDSNHSRNPSVSPVDAPTTYLLASRMTLKPFRRSQIGLAVHVGGKPT